VWLAILEGQIAGAPNRRYTGDRRPDHYPLAV
jgi:hypothetical protein